MEPFKRSSFSESSEANSMMDDQIKLLIRIPDCAHHENSGIVCTREALEPENLAHSEELSKIPQPNPSFTI